MTETFYDVLGVDRDAATSDIEDAYRERLKETHPDLNDDADADRATQRVIEAREVLTDEEERARYDRLGHEAYVGEGPAAGGDESGREGAATRAAREAGWAESDTEEPSESTAAGTNAGPSQRRRRERAASERVRQARESSGRRAETTTDHGADSVGGGRSSRSTDGGTATRGDGASSRGRRERERIYDSSGWSASGSYNVRQDVRPNVHPLRSLVAGVPLSLVALTFFLYPVMLFAAVFPPFPLVVNVTVGLCTLLLVGYLQSQPAAGIVVFGAWSLLVPVGLVVFGVSPTSVVGLIALAGTLLPFGFSVLTQSILRL